MTKHAIRFQSIQYFFSTCILSNYFSMLIWLFFINFDTKSGTSSIINGFSISNMVLILLIVICYVLNLFFLIEFAFQFHLSTFYFILYLCQISSLFFYCNFFCVGSFFIEIFFFNFIPRYFFYLDFGFMIFFGFAFGLEQFFLFDLFIVVAFFIILLN